MAAAGAGRSLITFTAALHQRIILGYSQSCPLLSQARHYAARKGTREKARKKKVKKEVKKVGFIPFSMRVKQSEIVPFAKFRNDDLLKPERVDDVWIEEFHKSRVYTFEEAIECHRQTHHSSMYNSPNAFVHTFVELDMMGERPTKMVEKFARVVDMPHPFDHGENRSIMVFAKDPRLLQLANEAGAMLSGDKDLIKQIQTGTISVNDYQYVVAHPDIMPELSVIRGLLKRKFPNPRTGTLGLNLPSLIQKIFNGVKYTVMPHDGQIQYGSSTILFGRLNMDVKQLEENFSALITDVEKARPKRDGEFVFRASIQSYPTIELLNVDFKTYLKNNEDDELDSDEEEEDVLLKSN